MIQDSVVLDINRKLSDIVMLLNYCIQIVLNCKRKKNGWNRNGCIKTMPVLMAHQLTILKELRVPGLVLGVLYIFMTTYILLGILIQQYNPNIAAKSYKV